MMARILSRLRQPAEATTRVGVGADFYLLRGRPPDLPQRESFFLCFLIVVLPPRLPMHRGQISSVSLWMGQQERGVDRDTAHILA
jgi:hypothetical protein